MIASTKKMKTIKTKVHRAIQSNTIWTRPVLKFTPYAWSKLRHLRDRGPTEVGGFGISNAHDLLLIEDIQLVRQSCTSTYVEFDDESVADFFDDQVDAGRKPEQFARTWIHTHPGSCPLPSHTDEETFERCFGNVDWALMFILARQGKSYSRLRINFGPTIQQPIRSKVNFDAVYPSSDHEAWDAEYETLVQPFDGFADAVPSWLNWGNREHGSFELDYPLLRPQSWENTNE